MAQAKKKRHQLLRNVALGALVFIMAGALLGSIIQAILVFMLTGIISGTTIVVPVWGMIVVYLFIVMGFSLVYYLDHTPTSRRYYQ